MLAPLTRSPHRLRNRRSSIPIYSRCLGHVGAKRADREPTVVLNFLPASGINRRLGKSPLRQAFGLNIGQLEKKPCTHYSSSRLPDRWRRLPSAFRSRRPRPRLTAEAEAEAEAGPSTAASAAEASTAASAAEASTAAWAAGASVAASATEGSVLGSATEASVAASAAITAITA